jgi:S1-C subfamily serine protease
MHYSRIGRFIAIIWLMGSALYIVMESYLRLPVNQQIRRPVVGVSAPSPTLTTSERRPAPRHEIYSINGERNLAAGTITSGTAFAVDSAGNWLTAWHVIDGCKQLYIATPDLKSGERVFNLSNKQGKEGTYTAIMGKPVKSHPTADMALIQTPAHAYAPVPLAEDDSYGTPSGQLGFAMGYPGASAGEAALEYMGNAYGKDIRSTYPLLVWAVRHQSKEMKSLRGISGGPLFDSKGHVVGINVAGDERRGRLMTTRPTSASHFIHNNLATYQTMSAPAFVLNQGNYQEIAKRLRKQNTITLVICIH